MALFIGLCFGDRCLLYLERLEKQYLFSGGLPVNSLLILNVFMLKRPSGGLCGVYPLRGLRGDISSCIHIHLILTIWKCLSSISKAVTPFDRKDLRMLCSSCQILPWKLFMLVMISCIYVKSVKDIILLIWLERKNSRMTFSGETKLGFGLWIHHLKI